jgi:putative Ca2+/H+ antiporter (TMEM165/GDT1 family)
MEANRVSEELEEVEEELLHRKKDDKENPDIEAGDHPDENRVLSTTPKSLSQQQPPPSSSYNKMKKISNSSKPNWLQICLSSLTLTFLAEWGDRSQIATIALAAAKNPYGVTAGGCLGHACCTGLAVMGGRMLAARISEKTVSFWGGVVFLLFGLHSMFLEQ